MKKEKGSKRSKRLTMIIVFAVLIVIWCVISLVYFSEDVEIMFESEKIHGAVEVNIENILNNEEGEFSKEVKDGVLGNYAVLCDSLEQFLELVPEGETIYTFFEVGEKESKFLKTGRYYSLSKTYLVIISGLGAIVYSDLYKYKNRKRRYWIEGWSWGSGLGNINFHYDNKEDIVIGVFVLFVIIFSFVIISAFINTPPYFP